MQKYLHSSVKPSHGDPARAPVELVPAVFLDRDGTINEMVYDSTHGLLDSPRRPEQVVVMGGAAAFMRQVRDLGFKLIVVTNQPGIAKGTMSLSELEAVNRCLADLLISEAAYWDKLYYCPHHPKGGATVSEYVIECDCRKPRPGLIMRAAVENGIDLARQTEKAMKEIAKSASEVDSIVIGINEQMEEIGKIVKLITDIANQTNLLALNAAIEAARAGDAGRGFAVVAAEVKSLAQDSRKSAENIADMISTLQTKAKNATEAMNISTTSVREGNIALGKTLTAFNQIADTVENITKNIVDVASASEEQAASVEEVTASIQEVSELVQNTAHEAGNAASATEETTVSIEEISKIVNNVVVIVDSVSHEMFKFKVS